MHHDSRYVMGFPRLGQKPAVRVRFHPVKPYHDNTLISVKRAKEQYLLTDEYVHGNMFFFLIKNVVLTESCSLRQRYRLAIPCRDLVNLTRIETRDALNTTRMIENVLRKDIEKR